MHADVLGNLRLGERAFPMPRRDFVWALAECDGWLAAENNHANCSPDLEDVEKASAHQVWHPTHGTLSMAILVNLVDVWLLSGRTRQDLSAKSGPGTGCTRPRAATPGSDSERGLATVLRQHPKKMLRE